MVTRAARYLRNGIKQDLFVKCSKADRGCYGTQEQGGVQKIYAVKQQHAFVQLSPIQLTVPLDNMSLYPVRILIGSILVGRGSILASRCKISKTAAFACTTSSLRCQLHVVSHGHVNTANICTALVSHHSTCTKICTIKSGVSMQNTQYYTLLNCDC